MWDLGVAGTGSYIIKTFIDVIKPLIGDKKKPLIPLLALCMWVMYWIVAVEWELMIRVAIGAWIWSTSVAGHETSKIFKSE